MGKNWFGAGLLCAVSGADGSGGLQRQDKGKLQKVTVCEVTHSIFYAPQYVAHGNRASSRTRGWTWSFPTAAARTK